ncbi:MAG: hypothetical protein LC685_01775, partial [Actinobacteria bacterium]|nr:hypothetical protein [Actinomycetota bacterium]
MTIYPGTDHQLTVAAGNIDTIAGATGSAGSGDGGAALGATLQGVPPSLAVAGGKLYIASYWKSASGSSPTESRVRVINLGGEPIVTNGVSVAPGNIETVAGGAAGLGGDGGPAQAAAFGYVPGIAVDSGGRLFLADESNQRVREVDAAGVMTTFAGGGGRGLAGGASKGDEGPAGMARLDHPYDVKVGPDGRIFISDQGNREVRVVDRAGTIHAAPGSEIALSWTCAREAPGMRSFPGPGGPTSVAADDRGNIYFANTDAEEIKRLDNNGMETTVAGTTRRSAGCAPGYAGCAGFSGDGGPATAARLNSPTAIALGSGGLYVLDSGNRRVRFINLTSDSVGVHGVTVSPGAIQTVAGNGTAGAGGDGGRAVDAELGALKLPPSTQSIGQLTIGPFGAFRSDIALGSLALDSKGMLFISDPANNRIRQVDTSGTITSFAGEGAPESRQECCRDPLAIALDRADNLYVSDRAITGEDAAEGRRMMGLSTGTRTSRSRVWVINRCGKSTAMLGQRIPDGAVRSVAGNGTYGFADNGAKASSSPLMVPMGLALDGRGNLYISEIAGNANPESGDVRRVDPEGRISLVAGIGQGGFTGLTGSSAGLPLGAYQATFNGDGLRGRFTSL